MINYSTNIENIARRKGLKIQQLLELSNISSSSYYNMKNNNKFSTETLEKFAETLNVKVSDLVKDNLDDAVKELVEDFEKIKDKMKEFEDKHLK